MATPAKMPRGAKGIEGVSCEKLSTPEISHLSGLLHRAVVHGQTQQVINVYKGSLALKSTVVPASHLVREAELMEKSETMGYSPKAASLAMGSMSDASKRQRDGESDWEALSYTGMSEIESTLPHDAYQGGDVQRKEWFIIHSNPKIETPKGLSIQDWGRVVCEMDKVKSLKMSYYELAKLASSNDEIAGYLRWIKKTYGTNDTGILQGKKVTRAVDLALFLEATGWEPSCNDDSEVSFIRRLK